MSKRQKKEQRRINMYFNNDNPQDLAIFSLISRAHAHSELPLSLGNFCKFFLGEFLLQMQVQAHQEEVEGANDDKE